MTVRGGAGREPLPRRSRTAGFTLIEVIAALVVFASGVLGAAALAGALSEAMRVAASRSEMAALGQQALDSLSTVPFDELVPGRMTSHLHEIRGRSFERTLTVSSQSPPRIREIEVVVLPSDDGPGPRFQASVVVVAPW